MVVARVTYHTIQDRTVFSRESLQAVLRYQSAIALQALLLLPCSALTGGFPVAQ